MWAAVLVSTSEGERKGEADPIQEMQECLEREGTRWLSAQGWLIEIAEEEQQAAFQTQSNRGRKGGLIGSHRDFKISR